MSGTASVVSFILLLYKMPFFSVCVPFLRCPSQCERVEIQVFFESYSPTGARMVGRKNILERKLLREKEIRNQRKVYSYSIVFKLGQAVLLEPTSSEAVSSSLFFIFIPGSMGCCFLHRLLVTL